MFINLWPPPRPFNRWIGFGRRGALFGDSRELDFSQFKPRSHYTHSALLQRYFRAMIWLGRTDFRLLEADGSGELQLNRCQVEAALALRSLMNAQANAAYRSVDAVVTIASGGCGAQRSRSFGI